MKIKSQRGGHRFNVENSLQQREGKNYGRQPAKLHYNRECLHNPGISQMQLIPAGGLQESQKAGEPTAGKVNLKLWQEGGPIKCVVHTMKKVFFYEFRGSKSEVAFLKFIAERARVLEKMVVVMANDYFSSGDSVNVKLKPLTSAKWISNKACKPELFKSPLINVASPPFSHELASDFTFADPFDLVYYRESL